MFAEDPQLFTVYEPLWITSLWSREYPTEVSHRKRNVVDVLRGILGCKFADSQAGTKFLSYTDRQWSGAFVKNPFKSAAFCNGTCKDFSKNPEYVDEVCLSKFKHSVTKIGEPRVPDNLLSSVVPQVLEENPETDVRVIQLVRDPRGSFNSRIKLGWMEEYHHWHFPNTVRYQCSKLAQNIKFGRNLPSKWRVKYLEVHYQDLAKHPIETAKSLYEFAGFQMSPKILDWVRKNTSPSKEELLKEKENVFSSVRNSSANADYWTQEAPINRTRIIEENLLEENPETDVRVIQLVRDPRGSFNSRIKLGWMEEYHHWHFPNTVRYQCSKLAQNIKFGRNLPSKWRVKYLEVHYQDLAKHPIETAKSMYEFAGFQMSPKILDWVRKNTSPSKEELLKEKENVFSSVRNSSANADYWTQEAPINRTRIIEENCKEAFDLLKLETMITN
ncbi:unnamed protein product [Porites evermanni]|uniref:Sulfotransferase domain-containing protein n=1 Tax=Porites evermanni TaxID=104178 RepID=A0ABN8LYF9_9CNID|nr:unnamed protein product [Porites evermanni]